jgi:hypothetical protein
MLLTFQGQWRGSKVLISIVGNSLYRCVAYKINFRARSATILRPARDCEILNCRLVT